MSHTNKFSLWQKIKRLLSTSAANLATKATKTRQEAPQTETTDANARQSDVVSDSISDADIFHNEATINAANNTTATSNADHFGETDNEVTFDNKVETDNDGATVDEANALNIEAQHKNNINDATPITDCLEHYLQDKQWHYNYYRPKAADSQQTHHLSLRMRNKQIECGYLFRIQENNGLLAVYGILPFLIPDSHQSAAMLLITQINYDMLIGNVEMDVSDGEIRYKNAIDVDAVGIDNDIIGHLLQSVVAMTTVTYDIFSDLIATQNPAADMSILLGELRQQADARTFFLPTQFVQ